MYRMLLVTYEKMPGQDIVNRRDVSHPWYTMTQCSGDEDLEIRVAYLLFNGRLASACQGIAFYLTSQIVHRSNHYDAYLLPENTIHVPAEDVKSELIGNGLSGTYLHLDY